MAGRPKKTKQDPKPISKYNATKYLNHLLTNKTCLSKVDGKILDEIMYLHPNLYLQYMSKLERGSSIPI